MIRRLLLIVVTLIGCGGGGGLSRDSGNDVPKDGDVATDVIVEAGGGAAGSGGLDAGSAGSAGSAGIDAGAAGGPGDSGMEASAKPLSLANYLSEELEIVCEFYARCGAYPDVASCLSVTPPDVTGTTLSVDVAAARVTYDGASARACLDGYIAATATCSTSAVFEQIALLEPCRSIFAGTLPAGSVCVAAEECVAGTDCLLSSPCTMACCAGTCVAEAPRGASCAAALCTDGSYCRPQTVRCTAKATVEGSVCDAEDGCADPFLCVFDEEGNGTCERAALPATGAPCQPAVGCDDYRDFCTPANVCARRIGLGRPCAEANADPGCVYYGYCEAGFCRARGLPGEACRTGASPTQTDCLGAVSCPPATMTCTPATGPPMSCR